MQSVPEAAENLQVLLLDDHNTPYDFVVALLVQVFGKDEVEARITAATAHHYGEVVCGLWPPMVAASLVEAAKTKIENEGHSLALVLRGPGGREAPGQDTCTFCGKPDSQAGLLYRRNGAQVCDRCILLASEHLEGRVGDADFTFTHEILSWHFAGLKVDDLVTSTRNYPQRMRGDLQLGLDAYFAPHTLRLLGFKSRYRYEAQCFADLFEKGHDALRVAPMHYTDLDIGGDKPVRCVQQGLWLLEEKGLRHAALVCQVESPQGGASTKVEIAAPAGAEGNAMVERSFDAFETAIEEARCYRGKILSLEIADRWSGMAGDVVVHRLPSLAREAVILPRATLELLDRNVIDFAGHRAKLKSFGQSAKKGLLFHGPPGTGKTHTVRYLATCLQGHTTFLVTAEQVALLPDYFALARLLQPSILVIEDADLIARQREEMGSACEESLLNRLLNEMDGLKEDAEIFFILTTNRPEQIEAALASRPGRIDQALEFPLPDEEARAKLVALYGRGLDLSQSVVDETVKRTEGVSPAFIKELMRRAAQAALERGVPPGSNGQDACSLVPADIEQAVDDMLFAGGRLNTRLLGGPQEDGQAV